MLFSAKSPEITTKRYRISTAPRRSVRLLQKSRIGKIRHHVPDRSRTQPFAAGARKRARPYRLSAGDECLDDGGKNFSFPPARWSCWHIYLRRGRSAPLNSLDAVA